MVDDLENAELSKRLLSVAPRYVQWAALSLRGHRIEGDPSFRQLALLVTIHAGVSSPAALAQQLGISRAVVTGLLDRLEERGLIWREPDPLDRRRLRIVMSAAGLEASERLGRAVVDDLAKALDVRSSEERQSLQAALPILERLIETLLDQAPTSGEAGKERDLWDDELPATPPLALQN